jgi:uncharacterized protein YqhQ
LTDQEEKRFRYDPDKPLQVGGQAVIEGVMMRAPGRIATAVRRANGQILVKKREYRSLAERNSFFRLPILRGAVGLVEMMFIGIDTLNFSTEVAMHDLKLKEGSNGQSAPAQKKNSDLRLILTVVLSLILGVGVFFVTPLFLTTRLFNLEQHAFTFNLTAGAIRLTILLIYLIVISLLRDVKRLFEYHGAEHKAVFTFESQGELTASSAAAYTRFHPRCGTSFILIVMLVSILLFAVIDSLIISMVGSISLPLRFLTHIPLIPLVGGASYEFIRWSAQRSTTLIGRMLVAPGLWLQRITTNEPDPTQIEVALVALKCALGVEEPEKARYIVNLSEIAVS